MKKNIKTLLTLISISGLWCYYFFYIYIPNYRINLINTSNEIINIFTNDYEIDWISRNNIRLTGYRGWCNDNTIYELCMEKKNKYKYIMKKIWKNTSYSFCSGWFIVKNSTSSIHYVWTWSPWNLLTSGLWFSVWFNWWLFYSVNPDRFNDAGSCYPWNDLERYWKIYGKASPEQIQSVIDLAKHPQ